MQGMALTSAPSSKLEDSFEQMELEMPGGEILQEKWKYVTKICGIRKYLLPTPTINIRQETP